MTQILLSNEHIWILSHSQAWALFMLILSATRHYHPQRKKGQNILNKDYAMRLLSISPNIKTVEI